VELVVALLWAPFAVVLVRKLFVFLDEGAEYEREVRELKRLGLRELDGRSIRRWVWQLRLNPVAVARYRQLRR
jgi:hypothetical protein